MSTSSEQDLERPLKGLKFYCAATLQDLDKARKMVDTLQSYGMICTYDWPAVGFVDVSEYRQCASNEIYGVLQADIFVGILPGKFGMQTELGAALGKHFLTNRNRVLLVSPNDDFYTLKHSQQNQYVNVFWHHPFVEKIIHEDLYEGVVNYLMNTF
jgi:hypothetical protein